MEFKITAKKTENEQKSLTQILELKSITTEIKNLMGLDLDGVS